MHIEVKIGDLHSTRMPWVSRQRCREARQPRDGDHWSVLTNVPSSAIYRAATRQFHGSTNQTLNIFKANNKLCWWRIDIYCWIEHRIISMYLQSTYTTSYILLYVITNHSIFNIYFYFVATIVTLCPCDTVTCHGVTRGWWAGVWCAVMASEHHSTMHTAASKKTSTYPHGNMLLSAAARDQNTQQQPAQLYR